METAQEIKPQPPPLHPLVVLDFKGCANCLAFQCTQTCVLPGDQSSERPRTVCSQQPPHDLCSRHRGTHSFIHSFLNTGFFQQRDLRYHEKG